MCAIRGATPRGIGRSSLATSSPSSASIEGRRNPRRYTTEDIDREIAAYKEGSDSDEDDEKDDGDDDDIGKKKKKKKTKKQPAVARGGGKRKVGSSSEEEHNDDTNDTEDDESDDSSDFGVSLTMKKKSAMMTTQQKRGTPKKKKQVWNNRENSDNDDDDDEEDDDNDSDSSSDFGGKKKKKKKKTMTTPSKSKTARSAGRKGGGRSPTTEMIKTPTPRKQPHTATIRGASTRRRDKSINDDNDDDNEEEIVYDTTPSGSRRPRRQCKTETLQRMSDTVAKLKQSEREALGDMLEDDDKELLFEGSSNNDDDDEDDDVNDDEVVTQKKKRGRVIVTANGRGCNVGTSPSRTGRKKLHEDDDDEDYNYGDSSSNASDDSDNNASDDNDDDDDIVPKQRRHRVTAKKCPSYLESDEEIGTADEDSDDEDTAPAVLTSPTRNASNGFGRRSGSPNARARARMGRTPLDIHESKRHNKFSNESSDDDSTDGNKRSRTRKIKPKCITCSSTTDNITMANLPRDKPHVCYIAPDGKTRHCYTLDTLYRIAISSKDNGSSTSNYTNLSLLGDVRSQTSSLQFLQPPHFRLPMEDDLLDQIASRFGRAALLIESSIMYKRLKGSTTGELDDFDEDGEYIGGSSYASRGGSSGSSSSSSTRLSFHERFEKYMQSLMGSADVYCCPLCFNEADRRLGIVDDELLEDDDTHNNDDDDDDNLTKDRFSFMDDPLTILGSLDSDEFISASSFCFRYLTGVKAHMNTIHGVNVKDIVGNDLFKRFQIRAPDGLLQNWIKRSLGHRNISVQGDMMRYWLGGGNQSFILLLNQIDKGDARGDVRSDFSLSFPNRAKKIWRDVSAPYLKQHDLGDFIAEEGDDDDESEGAVAADLHVNPNFTPSCKGGGGASFKSPEEQLIAHLQKRNSMKNKTFDSSDDDSSNTNNDNNNDDNDEDEDELEILPKPPQYEDIEEEEIDEWTQSKLLKAKKAKQGSQESIDTGDDDDDVELFDSNIETDNTTNVSGSAIRKRMIIDDEDNNSGTDSGLKAPPDISIGSSRKRTIAESSDDEESF